MERGPSGKIDRKHAGRGGSPPRGVGSNPGRKLHAAGFAAVALMLSFVVATGNTVARPATTGGQRVTVFNTGFESGLFSGWSTVKVGGDGAISVQSAVVDQGKLAAELSESTHAGSRAALRKTFPARYGDLSATGSFRVINQEAGVLPLFRFFDARWHLVATVYRQGQAIRIAYAGKRVTTRGTVPLNTWKSLTLHVVTNGARSTVVVLLNGKLIYRTRRAQLGTAGITTVQIGNDSPARPFTMAADAIQVQRGTSVMPSPPVNTNLPGLVGLRLPGRSVTANAGSWSGKQPIAHRYRWLRCELRGGHCKTIAHASKSTYVIRRGDIGSTLRVAVTSINSVGRTTVRSAAAAVQSAPASRALPSIAGTAREGSVVTASRGSWSGTAPLAYVYQWLRCDTSGANCRPITGAVASAYRVSAAEIGGMLRIAVTASNAAGSATANSPAVRALAAAPVNGSLPSILGTPQDGETLTADPGSWSGTAPIGYSYQWLRCDANGADCAKINGATGHAYVVGDQDVGTALRVNVTAANTVGSATAQSSAVEAAASLPVNGTHPSVSGTPQQGQTLTAHHGSWSGTPPITYTYQWLRCDSGGANCASISGASSSKYMVDNGDIGHKLRVDVTATNPAGSSAERSGATSVVQASASSGTVALWHMDETSGSTMNDSAGEHGGTLFHVQLGLRGVSGKAYGFNGSNSYASVSSANDLNPGAANLTVTIHLQSTGTPPAPPRDWDLIRKGDYAPGASEWKMEFQQTGQASCGFEGSSGYSELVAGPAINDGQWHTIECVKTSSAIEVVVDGHTFTQKAAIGSIGNTSSVVIGGHPGGDWYKGALDEASIQYG